MSAAGPGSFTTSSVRFDFDYGIVNKLHVVSYSDTSIYVAWQPPFPVSGYVFSAYRVGYAVAGALAVYTPDMPLANLSSVVGNLQPNTDYVVEIVAVVNGANGPIANCTATTGSQSNRVVFVDSYASFSSGYYPRNAEMYWILNPRAEYDGIEMLLANFNLECDHDFVRISFQDTSAWRALPQVGCW